MDRRQFGLHRGRGDVLEEGLRAIHVIRPGRGVSRHDERVGRVLDGVLRIEFGLKGGKREHAQVGKDVGGNHPRQEEPK